MATINTHPGRAGQPVKPDERRASPRLCIDVDVAYEPVPAERLREVADQVMSRINTLAEPTSETSRLLRTGNDQFEALRGEIAALREMIGELSLKIEDLAAFVTGAKPRAAAVRRPLFVQNCSATGLGMVTREPHRESDHLRLRLTIHSVPAIIIDCVAEVVRCRPLESAAGDEPGPRHDLGLRFTHIHEADRERLIHYIFKLQRRILQNRREARD